MNGSLAGIRYAKSLMGLATEKNALDAVFADMQLIASTVEESYDLELLLKSPVVKVDKKQAVLKSVFGGKISELSTLFLDLISNRKREGLVKDIAFELGFENQFHFSRTFKSVYGVSPENFLQTDD